MIQVDQDGARREVYRRIGGSQTLFDKIKITNPQAVLFAKLFDLERDKLRVASVSVRHIGDLVYDFEVEVLLRSPFRSIDAFENYLSQHRLSTYDYACAHSGLRLEDHGLEEKPEIGLYDREAGPFYLDHQNINVVFITSQQLEERLEH